MTTREEIVAEARRWIGTPFRHQARVRGAGTDCGGFIGGVAVELGIVPPDWWATTFDPIYGGYGRLPIDGRLQHVCETFMWQIPKQAMELGDVALLRFDAEPQHLAFIADYRHGGLSLVHALSTVGRVCEHRMTLLWKARITAVYRMPGVF